MRYATFVFFIFLTIPSLTLAIVDYNDSFRSAPTDPPRDTVDILWEASTTTPRWYKGRALASPGSTVRAIAIPHIRSNKQITYKWYRGTKLIKKSSDRDANMVELPAPSTYGRYILSVELLDSQGRVLGYNGSAISSISPKIMLYKKLPLIGITHNRALNTDNKTLLPLFDRELTLVGVPFYFADKEDRLSYDWFVKGAVFDKTSPERITIIRPLDKLIEISLKITGGAGLLQSAQVKYNIKANQDTIDTADRQANPSDSIDNNPFNAVKN